MGLFASQYLQFSFSFSFSAPGFWLLYMYVYDAILHSIKYIVQSVIHVFARQFL